MKKAYFPVLLMLVLASLVIPVYGGTIIPWVSPPEGVVASDGVSHDFIDIRWNSVDSVTGYHVYRADSLNGTYELLNADPIMTTYYIDNLRVYNPGKYYYYKVRARNGVSWSDYSIADKGYQKVVEGTLKWTFQTGGQINSCPALGQDGTIYVCSSDQNLYTIHLNGTKKWSIRLGYFLNTPALGADGTIYVTGEKLFAISSLGALLWEYETGAKIEGSPVIGIDGTVYIGASNGKIFAVQPDGKLKWERYVGSMIGSPAIDPDGTIYVGTVYEKKVFAIRPDGTIRWTYDTNAWIISGLAIGADGTIYVPTFGGGLHAVYPYGQLKWLLYIGGVEASPGIGADGTIYVNSSCEGIFRAIVDMGNCFDTYIKWDYQCSDRLYTSPAIGADGSIYFGCWDRKIHAVNPDGSLRWTYETSDMVESSPTIGSDCVLYVGSNDGKLYAIYTDSGDVNQAPWPTFQQNMQRMGRKQ